MIRILLVSLVSLTLVLDATAHSLNYEVDLTNARERKVKVTLRPVGLGKKTMTFQMPAWSPGAYSVTNYGRYVKNFKALTRAGKSLATTQLTENRWQIANAAKLDRIEYEVHDSRRDSTSLWFAMAHIDSNLFFANATTLFGYVNDVKSAPATVVYKKPQDWELASGLNYSGKSPRDCAFRVTTFTARNYDELVDAPVLASSELQTRCFQQGSARYEIVVVSQKPFEMDSLEHYTKEIIKVQTDFFKETPFKHYTFLYYNPTYQHMPSFAQGALEHANSSAYLLVNIPWSSFKTFGLRIISHEFFHLWNVKRIHSTLLGPFDYTKGVRTSSLWLSEGVTDYYAHALLSRNNIVSPESFLSDIRGWYSSATESRVARLKSLEQLSLEESDFEIENASTFYTKGPLVGWMMDLEIRTQTGNKRSLDDVMLALNKDASKGKHFRDSELISKIEKISGADLGEFQRKYIAGTDSIPLEVYLNKMGLTAKGAIAKSEDELKIGFSSEGLLLQSVPEGSQPALAGLRTGDVIKTINGQELTLDNVQTLFGTDPEAEVVIEVLRNGEIETLRFKPADIETRQAHGEGVQRVYEVLPDATPLQIAIRDAVMGVYRP